MGFLSDGVPLKWKDSIVHHKYVKEHGIIQFLNIYKRLKNRKNDKFRWGDEVEGLLVKFDHENRRVTLSLRADKLLDTVHETIAELKNQDSDLEFHANFLPEYGNFMVEATPGQPYGNTTADLRLVEHNMRLRRRMIEELLAKGEGFVTLVAFPTLGVGTYSTPQKDARGEVANSRFIHDQMIAPHPRFATLTQNIRVRRGANVDIRVPLFQDTNTRAVALEEKDNPDEIEMDAMAFGMGCCCLQETFQARSLTEARDLYDQLAVLTPVMLALTAATPFLRGKISDFDVRWTVISQSVDDRNDVERGVAEPKEDDRHQRIKKSRYDSISCYLSTSDCMKESYNDIDLEIDQPSYDKLRKEGIDHTLARHIAHLFIRDPLVIYGEYIKIDDEKESAHFETVRFKPPPPGTTTGWRVEFRSMEISITDTENAAFAVFVALLSRAILFYKLNFYVPISKVDQNMKKAHKRDAVRTEKFFFRTNWSSVPPTRDEYDELTVNEILNGKRNSKGLVSIVRDYLQEIKCDEITLQVVNKYLDIISKRASGELLTTAQFLRRFALNHPDYKQDSVITESMSYDISLLTVAIEKGAVLAPQYLAKHDVTAHEDGLKILPLLSPEAPASRPYTISIPDDEAKAKEAVQEAIRHLRAHAQDTL